jgi:DNA-binding NtrC family response regulator
MKILHVEDDTAISSLAKAVFNTTHHEFLICNNPEEALKVIQCYHIDLIILDLVFTNSMETGFKILDRIESSDLDTKVIIYSGYLQDVFQEPIQYYKSRGYILSAYEKPSNFRTIVDEIEKYGETLKS